MNAVLVSVFALAILVLILTTRRITNVDKEGQVTYVVYGPGWGGPVYPWWRRRFHPWRRFYLHF